MNLNYGLIHSAYLHLNFDARISILYNFDTLSFRRSSLGTFLSPGYAASQSCPTDYVEIGGSCFQFFDVSADYSTARDVCVSNGGDLPVLHDCDMFGAVMNYIITQGKTYCHVGALFGKFSSFIVLLCFFFTQVLMLIVLIFFLDIHKIFAVNNIYTAQIIFVGHFNRILISKGTFY